MKLEQQVTSLEISKRLKELGVKQKSLFWWWTGGSGDGQSLHFEDKHGVYDNTSAFTVSELGEMLPEESYTYKHSDSGGWVTHFKGQKDGTQTFKGAFEADARGKMFIYLLENKLT